MLNISLIKSILGEAANKKYKVEILYKPKYPKVGYKRGNVIRRVCEPYEIKSKYFFGRCNDPEPISIRKFILSRILDISIIEETFRPIWPIKIRKPSKKMDLEIYYQR